MGDAFKKRVNDIGQRAKEMKSALFFPVVDDSTGRFIADKEARHERISSGISGTVFESAGENAMMIAETASNSYRAYCNTYGEEPSDEMLASSHRAIENALLVTGSKDGKYSLGGGMVLEAAEMSTTEGLLLRDRMVALVLPHVLETITARFVTLIPGEFNKSEIFKMEMVAGSDFGGLAKGDVIDLGYAQQYSSMDQRVLTGTGNGAITGSSHEFKLDSAAKFGKKMPFKKQHTRVYLDRNVVATDESGILMGSFVNAAKQTVTVTGTIDHANGIVDPIFSIAPAAGLDVHIGVDIDIEKDASLIPSIDHVIDAKTLRPHQHAISAGVTLQALWEAQREYGFSLDSMSMVRMRNLIAADKDRKILNDLRFFALGEQTIPMAVSANDIGYYLKDIREAILAADAMLTNRTKIAGLSAIIGDTLSVAKFRALPPDMFRVVPGYVKKAQPHYVGRLMDAYDVYEDPNSTVGYECVGVAKGNGIGECGYVAGDAIPPLAFKHALQGDLNYRSTLWGLGYRDLNPFSGRNFFIKLKITLS